MCIGSNWDETGSWGQTTAQRTADIRGSGTRSLFSASLVSPRRDGPPDRPPQLRKIGLKRGAPGNYHEVTRSLTGCQLMPGRSADPAFRPVSNHCVPQSRPHCNTYARPRTNSRRLVNDHRTEIADVPCRPHTPEIQGTTQTADLCQVNPLVAQINGPGSVDA